MWRFEELAHVKTLLVVAAYAALATTVCQASPALLSSERKGQLPSAFDPVRLIPRGAQEDTRRRLSAVEMKEFGSVGFLHSKNDLSGFVGSAFSVSSRVVVTAGHNFWNRGTPNLALKTSGHVFDNVEYYSQACRQSYKIMSVETLSRSPETDRTKDFGLVVLQTRLCPEAAPLGVRTMNAQDIATLKRTVGSEYISVPAFQLLRRRLSGVEKETNSFTFLISYGELLGFNKDRASLANHTASTLPGSSGAPLIAYVRGGNGQRVPVAVGVNITEHDEEPFNTARLFDAELQGLIDGAIRASP